MSEDFPLTEAQRIKYERMYNEATDFAMKEIHLHDRRMPRAGWWLRFKLRKAARMLEEVVRAYPESYSSMWMLGKIQERLENQEGYFTWLARSYETNPSQPDVAREASMAAMNLGRHDDAIAYAHRAAQVDPNDPGLKSNLALAYLLAGKTIQAQEPIAQALAANPTDKISQTVAEMIAHFASKGTTPPSTTQALTDYWRRRPKS
jgi:tetratricopeptide (TPR) repeat protein